MQDGGKAGENAIPKTAVLKIPESGDFEGDTIWTDDDFIGIDFHADHKTMVKLITGQSAVTAA